MAANIVLVAMSMVIGHCCALSPYQNCVFQYDAKPRAWQLSAFAFHV
jgi:hypothetical protein